MGAIISQIMIPTISELLKSHIKQYSYVENDGDDFFYVPITKKTYSELKLIFESCFRFDLDGAYGILFFEFDETKNRLAATIDYFEAHTWPLAKVLPEYKMEIFVVSYDPRGVVRRCTDRVMKFFGDKIQVGPVDFEVPGRSSLRFKAICDSSLDRDST